MSYPVEWNGNTYMLGDLTVGAKKAFVKAAKLFLTTEAMENIERDDKRNSFLGSLYSMLWWADAGCSPQLYDFMRSPMGGLTLNRILFGNSVKAMSDADLSEMLAAKEADPKSDYMIAMDLIRSESDPKGSGPATGTALKDATSSTSAS